MYQTQYKYNSNLVKLKVTFFPISFSPIESIHLYIIFHHAHEEGILNFKNFQVIYKLNIFNNLNLVNLPSSSINTRNFQALYQFNQPLAELRPLYLLLFFFNSSTTRINCVLKKNCIPIYAVILCCYIFSFCSMCLCSKRSQRRY